MFKRKFIPLFLLLVGFAQGVRADSSETGDWSVVVNGLQGRLSIVEDPAINGTRQFAVYLELRNLSDSSNPMEIYYDNTNANGTMVNREGKPVAALNSPVDILLHMPYWLTLPHDSSLRFRVSTGCYGIPKNAGAMVDLRGGPWLVKRDRDSPYFLSSIFQANEQKAAAVTNQWHGTLELPRVQVPLGAVASAFRTTGP